jgi:hypothetical protein
MVSLTMATITVTLRRDWLEACTTCDLAAKSTYSSIFCEHTDDQLGKRNEHETSLPRHAIPGQLGEHPLVIYVQRCFPEAKVQHVLSNGLTRVWFRMVIRAYSTMLSAIACACSSSFSTVRLVNAAICASSSEKTLSEHPSVYPMKSSYDVVRHNEERTKRMTVSPSRRRVSNWSAWWGKS